jgi:hypothetical protein
VLEILKFVLSILGLTWQNIRQKLVRATSEGVVRAMETGFDIVVTLVTQGPAAAWQRIQEGISNLREMVMEQIMTFVRDRVVQAAITRLVTSLNPAGAFIQAVIAIYNTVMFFVERLRQIAQVAMAFIDSIAAIASGSIGAAANRVEQTMAGLLTLVISFLARIAGLGRVSDAVTNIVNRIRAPIDRALDRVIEWIVNMARRAGRFLAQAGLPQDPNERLQLGLASAERAVNALQGASVTAALINPVLTAIRVRYGFRTLVAVDRSGEWWVGGVINPPGSRKTRKVSRVTGLTPQQIGAALAPVLAAAERRWLAELAGQESQSSRSRLDIARTRLAAGGPAAEPRQRGRVNLPALSREQEIRLLREVGQPGGVQIQPQEGRTMRAAAFVTGGSERTGGMYINRPGELGPVFIPSAGEYEGSIPRHVAGVSGQVTDAGGSQADVLRQLSPTRQRLTRVLEPAREEGMLVGRRVGEELVSSRQATAAEVTHGELAPMAFTGATGNEPADVQRRQTGLGNLVQRLRDAALHAEILDQPGGNVLQRLGGAVERWLSANFRPSTDPRRLQSETGRLEQALLAFLRHFQGGN